MKKLMMAVAAACAAVGAFELKAGPLPECFTQVEYIESTGVQSINTGFAPTDRTVVEMDITLRSTARQALFSAGQWGNNRFMPDHGQWDARPGLHPLRLQRRRRDDGRVTLRHGWGGKFYVKTSAKAADFTVGPEV